MARFWDMFEKSMIVQGLITFMVIATACYLMATGRPVPELLASSLYLVLGFYFGSKFQYMVSAVNARKVSGRDKAGR